MNAHERAGRLLALAITTIADKADGRTNYLHAQTIRQAAEVCAEYGTDRALGWVDGWWYVHGNKSIGGDDSSANETWRAIREQLGQPVR